jgi:signal transduction histidine kinase
MAAGWFFGRLRKKLLTRLDHQNEGVRRSLRLRRRMLGTLLHDFHNPLQALMLRLEVQKRGNSQDSAKLQPLVRRMGDILKNSRDLLSVEGIAPPERLRRMEWARMVSKVEEMFTHRLSLKGITLRVEGDPASSVYCLPEVLCDSVLANLVSNALKFSPRDGLVEMTCEDRGNHIAIRVSDQGPGIPDSILKGFLEGRRLESAPGSEGEKGTGLGLMLARDYARFMGGDLELGPRPGGGTEAVLTLQRYQEEPQLVSGRV